MLHVAEQADTLAVLHKNGCAPQQDRKIASDDTTWRCVATFRGNDAAKQAETRCNGPFEAERQLDAMAANALHVRSGSRQPIVRCVNRVARNSAISADIACEGYRVPSKQLLDEMADEMRAHLRPENSPLAFGRSSRRAPMQRLGRARGVPMEMKSEFVRHAVSDLTSDQVQCARQHNYQRKNRNGRKCYEKAVGLFFFACCRCYWCDACRVVDLCPDRGHRTHRGRRSE